MNSRYFSSAAIIRLTPIINLSRSGRNCSKIANYEKRRSILPADHTERVRRNSFDLLVDFQIRWAQVQERSLRKGKSGGPKLNEIATRLQRRKLRRKFLRGTGIVPQKFSAFSKKIQPVFDGENETHNTHVLIATRKVEIYSDCDGGGKKKKKLLQFSAPGKPPKKLQNNPQIPKSSTSHVNPTNPPSPEIPPAVKRDSAVPFIAFRPRKARKRSTHKPFGGCAPNVWKWRWNAQKPRNSTTTGDGI